MLFIIEIQQWLKYKVAADCNCRVSVMVSRNKFKKYTIL